MCCSSLGPVQLTASNMEGRSCPSEVLVCTTSPDRPGPPTRPLIKGPVTSHGFSVKWGTSLPRLLLFLFDLFSFQWRHVRHKHTISSVRVSCVCYACVGSILRSGGVNRILMFGQTFVDYLNEQF